jgi:hypothetical protein
VELNGISFHLNLRGAPKSINLKVLQLTILFAC